MKFEVKTFESLTKEELYEILRLRAEIFIIEQNCVCLDPDGADYNCLHVFCKENGRVIAYSRIYDKVGEPETAKLGRVVNMYHGKGLGRKLMEKSIEVIKSRNYKKVYIEAQKYAEGFYEKFGFKTVSDEFMLDDIPHIKMELNL